MSHGVGRSHRKGLDGQLPPAGRADRAAPLDRDDPADDRGPEPEDAFDSWGWRVPFLLSFVLVLIGLYVRLRVLESPEFREVKKADAVVKRPFIEVLKEHPMEILTSAFVRMSEQAPFYIFITFVLTYGTTILQIERNELLNYTLVAAAVGFISVPLFGYVSDRIGRRLMYGIGIVCTALFAFPYFGLLNTKVAGLVLVGIVVSLIFHDMQYGPQAALIAESFGTNLRYSGAGDRLPARVGHRRRSGPADRGGHPREDQVQHGDQLVHHRLLRRLHGRPGPHATNPARPRSPDGGGEPSSR